MSHDMAGTMFKVGTKVAETSPERVGVITIDGVKMNFAVYPPKTSRQGRKYNPIKLSYPKDEPRRLAGVITKKKGK